MQLAALLYDIRLPCVDVNCEVFFQFVMISCNTIYTQLTLHVWQKSGRRV
jgi:hypothetical protein